MSSDCIFCRIGRGEIPSQKCYEDDAVYCISDLHPQAQKHFLVIPKMHYRDWSDTFSTGNSSGVLWEKLARAVHAVSQSQGLGQGYRVVANTGSHGTQSVFHLHLHVLGGEPLAPRFGR